MANLKISELTSVSAADIDATDQLPLADMSASQTKKATPLDLFVAGVRLAPAGSIPSAKVDWAGAGVSDATTATKGVVQLADAAAVTAGTAGRVVTADQLKATNDAISSATGGQALVIAGAAPVVVTEAGSTRTISVNTATTGSSGLITATDKAKLDGITAGAEVNVQADWTVTDSNSDAFIKNKPSGLAAVAGSGVSVGGTAAAPTVSGIDASSAVKGVVQLADSAAVTSGTAGRVVDAALLKTQLDAKLGLAGGTLSGPVTFAATQTFPKIPQNAQSTAYTLQASDAGKHVSITTGGITVPASVFTVGDAITIYNNSASAQTIAGGSVTLQLAGTATTGSRSLAQRGLCTLLCVAANVFVVSGAGLT